MFGGRTLDRISSFSSNSFFIVLHMSATEFPGVPGLLDDDVKLEKVGALAEWWKFFGPPTDKGKFVTTNSTYSNSNPLIVAVSRLSGQEKILMMAGQ